MQTRQATSNSIPAGAMIIDVDMEADGASDWEAGSEVASENNDAVKVSDVDEEDEL